MKDLSKVDSSQIYDICKNIVVCLLIIIAVLVSSNLLPFYFAPALGLGGAALLFSMLYTSKLQGGASCMLIPYALFFCLIAYSFISILINVMYIWGWMQIPDEFIFFNDPYIPALWMMPIIFITLLVVYSRKRSLRLCIDCRIDNGSHIDRGVFGSILNRESKVQLKNLIWVFGGLSVIIWTYYLIEYERINTNPKDRYVFFWVCVILIAFDILYFLHRYYNLYLDLKENDELITPEESRSYNGKTYLRYYVICGNKVYLNPQSEDATTKGQYGIDTPFFTSHEVPGVTTPQVEKTIKELTGGKDGELRFFFGRKAPDLAKHIVLRFFYFLDGTPEEYEDMNAPGGWFDFEEVKEVYNSRPDLMASLAMNDLSRLATIVITERTYKENGQRKHKLKNYNPSFDLIDVRDSNIDFQDDKWLKVSIFNADSKFFHLRKWVRNHLFRSKRRRRN